MADLTPAQLKDLRERCYRDPVLFCKEFLPHLFQEEIPWFHRGILSILTGRTAFLHKYGELDKIVRNFISGDEDHPEPLFVLDTSGEIHLRWKKYVQLMIPRSFSKTTLAGIAITLYDILYQSFKVGVYVSETTAHAEMQLDNVKRELMENPKILQVFGDLRPQIREAEKWSAKVFETKTGVSLFARGRGSQIRGLNHRGVRPQKIIVDDVEDKESVETELQRKKTRKWFYGDLIPALPSLGRGQIIALGTLLHPEALLVTLQGDPQWSVVKFSILDREGEFLWPLAMNEKKLALQKQSFANAGELVTFYLEYYNEVRNDETAKFQKRFFRYGKPAPEEKIVAASTYCDPAISKSETADECVIITVRQNNKGEIYVSEGWGKRGPDTAEVMEEFFSQHSKHQSRFNGIEANAYQSALVHEVRKQMFIRRVYFEVTPVTNARRKPERILGVLQGRLSSGYIIFEKRFASLETQLLDYHPDRDQHDDWPDALAGAIQLLDPVAAYHSKMPLEDDEDFPTLEEELDGSANFAS